MYAKIVIAFTVSIESDGDIISLNHWTHCHVLL